MASKTWTQTAQVAFTYVGTVVGAGFASGQEILQFFTRYGAAASLTIALASVLFVWLGIKMMLMAHDVRAESYEDLNIALFGPKIGRWISLFTLFVLFGISSVMLAGGGTVFSEHLSLPFQSGLLVTAVLSYAVITRGIGAIMAVNTIVVPVMATFSLILVFYTNKLPTSQAWLTLGTDHSPLSVWTAPLLYVGFNLATAQAVLVPLGAQIKDRRVLFRGALLGGLGIGLLLFAAHYALSAQMPGIRQFGIPMARIMDGLGTVIPFVYLLVIYGEIFTTYLSNTYGLTLQLQQRTGLGRRTVLLLLIALSYIVSLIGFKPLLSALYPLFGLVSSVWLAVMMWRNRSV
ncbi:YkvI family membrane protein [Paenibacillus chitinolyticus]|uniref:YkvI family membrane protein n=1 Tax=Paenibacillus chitinolyticus TaxID=79263 RepID=UPI00363AD74A